jgi:hypothetical protein
MLESESLVGSESSARRRAETLVTGEGIARHPIATGVNDVEIPTPIKPNTSGFF